MSYGQPTLVDHGIDFSPQIDLSPQGYMIRLREAEAQDQNDGLQKIFIMKKAEQISVASNWLKDHICQKRPEHKEFADYLEYFQALASSQLSDEKKIEDKFVLIPYFTTETQEKQRRRAGFVHFQSSHFYLDYAIQRLLYAALCRIEPSDDRLYGIDQKNILLSSSLYHSDVSLTEKLLKNGVNPNLFDIENRPLGDRVDWSFLNCKTVAEAQLLLDYGANLQEQQKRVDVVERICLKDFQESSDLLRFYLDRISLSEDNQFGSIWFEMLLNHALSNSYVETDRFSKRCNILLSYGCVCDEKSLMDMVESYYHQHHLYPEQKPQIKSMLRKLLAPAFVRWSDRLKAIVCQPAPEHEDVKDLVSPVSIPEREDVQKPIVPDAQRLTAVQSLIIKFNNPSKECEEKKIDQSLSERKDVLDLTFPDVKSLIRKFNSQSKKCEKEE